MEPPWRERIVELARRANVAAKISGVVAYADKETWTLDDIRPLRRACDDELLLGPRRLGRRLARAR